MLVKEQADATVGLLARRGIRRDPRRSASGPSLTDNWGAHRSHPFAATRLALSPRHHFTRHYSQQTNGQAAPFTKTLSQELPLGQAYGRIDIARGPFPPAFLLYNAARHHGALLHHTPLQRHAA